MKVRNQATGEVVDLPDGTTEDAIHAHFSGGQAQAQPQGLAQSFMSAGQQVVPQLAASLAAPQQQSTLPNIGGGSVVGLTPQQAQFTLQSAQQSNVDSMANKMRQQQMTQQSLESEADRAQTLKLRQQELKNAIAQKKMETEQAKFEAKQKADLETLKENNASAETLAEIGKPVNVSEGGALVKDGMEIYKNPKTYAPPDPANPPKPELIDTMDEAGNPIQKWIIPEPGAAYPSQPTATSSRSSSSGNSDMVEGSKEYSSAIHDRAKIIMENSIPKDGEQPLSVAEAYEQAEKIVRQENNLSPWGENIVARRNAVQSKQVEFYPEEEAKFTSKFGAPPETPSAQAYIQKQAQLRAEKWALEEEGFIAEIDGEKLYKRGK